jgi:DNA-directed RNA polymerase subunit H
VGEKSMDTIRHILVPEHIKLSAKEKDDLLKKHNISFIGLPKIRFKDAAIAHLDAKHGDIIKIMRKSATAGSSIFYRGVVNE